LSDVVAVALEQPLPHFDRLLPLRRELEVIAAIAGEPRFAPTETIPGAT
jgi:hypothetical protein